MPKTRARKRGIARGGTRKPHSSRPRAATQSAQPVQLTQSAAARSAAVSTRGIQGLVMSALVAIGCWAFAYYTFLFYRDSNSYLFAGMAALLALAWSVSFFVRLRKWRRER